MQLKVVQSELNMVEQRRSQLEVSSKLFEYKLHIGQHKCIFSN